MIITTVLDAFDNRTGMIYFKRRNRDSIYRRLPARNDTDDYHDVYYDRKEYEALEMYNRNNGRNYRRRGNHFLARFVKTGIFILIAVIALVILVRMCLIPLELKSYNPVHEKRWIGSLVLQHQQKINSNFLAQFTYLNANRKSQSVNDEQPGNGVIVEVAYIVLPGFAIPGERSGIKSVGIDIQNVNPGSNQVDPPVLSNNTITLNGGTDSFFNLAQTIPIFPVTATLTTLTIGPIKGFAAHCYNIYAKTEPTFAIFAEPATGQCLSPFTHS